jgi:carboxypeptidase Taq
MPDPYQQLLPQLQRLHRLRGAMALLSWDQEVTMPAAGIASRAGHRATLAELIHAQITDPALGELLDAVADRDDLPPPARADLREARRARDRAVKLPASLVRELAEATALAQADWQRARADDDWPRFAPHLARLVELKRREATALGAAAEPYDALLDEFEPGLRAAEVAEIFDGLRRALAELVSRFAARDPQALALPPGPYPLATQETLSRRILTAMGYDFEAGRLDVSAHPFTESMGRGDVRVTSAFHPDNLLSGLTSTMHEGGHALYEQGLPAELHEQPAGQAVSVAVHESQSRLWENHVGRSLPFCRWLAPILALAFPRRLGGLTPEALYRAANVVQPSPIRIEADEVTYNLHVVLRFEIERALFSGALEPDGVPEAWRTILRRDLGLEVEDDRHGALQDIHWSLGVFGYFPTYTLGNLYAAMFWEQARRELPELDDHVARGDFAGLRGWLREKIHARGSILTAAELCREITGRDLASDDFIAHLKAKHTALARR